MMPSTWRPTGTLHHLPQNRVLNTYRIQLQIALSLHFLRFGDHFFFHFHIFDLLGWRFLLEHLRQIASFHADWAHLRRRWRSDGALALKFLFLVSKAELFVECLARSLILLIVNSFEAW